MAPTLHPRQQQTPMSARIPPDVPSDPSISDKLGVYLRNFALWARNGFAEQMRNNEALQGVMFRGYNSPPGVNPNVFMLEVGNGGQLYLAPMALGSQADPGTPVLVGSQNYLPLSGGTLTGPLIGTTATFSGTVTAGGNIAATGQVQANNGNVFARASGGGNAVFWCQSNASVAMGNFFWNASANQVGFNHLASSPPSGAFLDTNGTFTVTGAISAPQGLIGATGWIGRQGTGAGAATTQANNFYWNNSTLDVWVSAVKAGTIALTSDYRIKKDVIPLDSTWDRVKELKPISYTHQDWTPSGVDQDNQAHQPLIVGDNIERWGFLAHELQETLVPSVASGVKDGDELQSPNPWTVIAALTKTVQELQARVEELEAR